MPCTQDVFFAFNVPGAKTPLATNPNQERGRDLWCTTVEHKLSQLHSGSLSQLLFSQVHQRTETLECPNKDTCVFVCVCETS